MLVTCMKNLPMSHDFVDTSTQKKWEAAKARQCMGLELCAHHSCCTLRHCFCCALWYISRTYTSFGTWDSGFFLSYKFQIVTLIVGRGGGYAGGGSEIIIIIIDRCIPNMMESHISWVFACESSHGYPFHNLGTKSQSKTDIRGWLGL